MPVLKQISQTDKEYKTRLLAEFKLKEDILQRDKEKLNKSLLDNRKDLEMRFTKLHKYKH